MNQEKVLKVINFHSLLKMNKFKGKINSYQNISNDVFKIIKELYFNKTIYFDRNALIPDSTKPKLNIYIANDSGLCGNYNTEVIDKIKTHPNDYKIIIGRKITYDDEFTLLKLSNRDGEKSIIEIEKIINDGLRGMKYSEINIFYVNYNNYSDYSLKQIELFPIKYDGKSFIGLEFESKSNVLEVIKGLISYYICYQIYTALDLSRVSENRERKRTTDIALKKVNNSIGGE